MAGAGAALAAMGMPIANAATRPAETKRPERLSFERAGAGVVDRADGTGGSLQSVRQLDPCEKARGFDQISQKPDPSSLYGRERLGRASAR